MPMKVGSNLRTYLYILAIFLFGTGFVASRIYSWALIFLWAPIFWLAFDLSASSKSKYRWLAATGKWLDKPRSGKH